jgi:hypothetical protein
MFRLSSTFQARTCCGFTGRGVHTSPDMPQDILVVFAFWYGQRFATRKSTPSGAVDMAELGPRRPQGEELADGELLNDEGKAELEIFDYTCK